MRWMARRAISVGPDLLPAFAAHVGLRPSHGPGRQLCQHVSQRAEVRPRLHAISHLHRFRHLVLRMFSLGAAGGGADDVAAHDPAAAPAAAAAVAAAPATAVIAGVGSGM